ncbi:MAG: hypothetical protein WBO55_02995 [Rhizobiaceae bacterium]
MDTNSPTYHALMRRRSEIAGQINHWEAQVSKAKCDLTHIDATLAIMGYDVPNIRFRAKTTGTAGLFHRGELGRLMLTHLRMNKDGLTIGEIAFRIASDKAWNAEDKRFMIALADKIGKHASKIKARYGLRCDNVNGDWVWRV